MSTAQERREVYATQRWRSLRTKTLKRAGWLCERCAESGRTVGAELVHHVEPWQSASGDGRQRLAFAAENLMAVCRACHGELHTHAEPNPWDGLVRQSLNEVKNEDFAKAGVAPL